MKNARNRRGGNALIEFSLLGVPLMFVTISVVSISIDMWEFHNLAFATDATARYISMHGATCSANSNSCTITVGNVANYFETVGMALMHSTAVLYLTDGSGTTTCNPVSTCTSSSTQFPNASYNSVGSDIKVKATYVLKSPFPMYWPPRDDPPSDFTVAATSRQRILF
jgi:Flp pilus assembly protein TadG